MRGLADDAGSAAAEFVLVSVLLVALALAVVQFALALHVRTTVLDAAGEGARIAALAGAAPGDGVQRTRDLIGAALGPSYAGDVRLRDDTIDGHPAVVVTVRTTLPLAGLFGPDRAMEVSGRAAVERLD